MAETQFLGHSLLFSGSLLVGGWSSEQELVLNQSTQIWDSHTFKSLRSYTTCLSIIILFNLQIILELFAVYNAMFPYLFILWDGYTDEHISHLTYHSSLTVLIHSLINFEVFTALKLAIAIMVVWWNCRFKLAWGVHEVLPKFLVYFLLMNAYINQACFDCFVQVCYKEKKSSFACVSWMYPW